MRVYDERWTLDATLKDGSPVLLRPGRPSDKALLAEGFAHLSERSRQLRFLAAKARLSESELRYLTEVDGEKHFALGAMRVEDGREHGLGVARFVQLPDQPGVAEPAIVVTDEVQGLGLGTLLMTHLSRAAVERGIHTFEATFLLENHGIKHLIEDLSPNTVFEQEGPTVHAHMRLSLPAEHPLGVIDVLADWLRHAARGDLRLFAPRGG